MMKKVIPILLMVFLLVFLTWKLGYPSAIVFVLWTGFTSLLLFSIHKLENDHEIAWGQLIYGSLLIAVGIIAAYALEQFTPQTNPFQISVSHCFSGFFVVFSASVGANSVFSSVNNKK